MTETLSDYILIVNTENLTLKEIEEIKAYLLEKGCSL